MLVFFFNFWSFSVCFVFNFVWQFHCCWLFLVASGNFDVNEKCWSETASTANNKTLRKCITREWGKERESEQNGPKIFKRSTKIVFTNLVFKCNNIEWVRFAFVYLLWTRVCVCVFFWRNHCLLALAKFQMALCRYLLNAFMRLPFIFSNSIIFLCTYTLIWRHQFLFVYR